MVYIHLNIDHLFRITSYNVCYTKLLRLREAADSRHYQRRAVSVAGVIGFVGLIMPHLLRRIIGPDNRILVPASFLGGCLLLLVADTLTRAVLPHEIPIGILTSLIGGPFFCYIFITSKRRVW